MKPTGEIKREQYLKLKLFRAYYVDVMGTGKSYVMTPDSVCDLDWIDSAIENLGVAGYVPLSYTDMEYFNKVYAMLKEKHNQLGKL